MCQINFENYIDQAIVGYFHQENLLARFISLFSVNTQTQSRVGT
jgi:hypothetical protein